MNKIKKIAKIAMVCCVLAFMPKACHMNYVCNVIEEIPQDVKEFIWERHPECYNIDVLADFWVEHGVEVLAEMESEYEFAMYHNLNQ